MIFNLKSHWEDIYQNKKPNEVSWTQEIPQTSIDFLKSFKLSKDSSIIDIGGGESKLVDYLLAQGYNNITVLDISKNAIEKAKKRIGENSDKVKWIVSNINEFIPENNFDFWHDRAVFHFLTDIESRVKYKNLLYKAVKKGGHLVIATFGPDGPLKCSGLTVERYSAAKLDKELGTNFKLLGSKLEEHHTPFNTSQQFLYCWFQVL